MVELGIERATGTTVRAPRARPHTMRARHSATCGGLLAALRGPKHIASCAPPSSLCAQARFGPYLSFTWAFRARTSSYDVQSVRCTCPQRKTRGSGFHPHPPPDHHLLLGLPAANLARERPVLTVLRLASLAPDAGASAGHDGGHRRAIRAQRGRSRARPLPAAALQDTRVNALWCASSVTDVRNWSVAAVPTPGALVVMVRSIGTPS